jgi:hypothetical protein
MPQNVEAESMTPAPAVRCSSCQFAWNSAAMAEGLRLLGSCPKCSGTLEFRGGEAAVAERFDRAAGAAVPARAERGPHLVLGIPRR